MTCDPRASDHPLFTGLDEAGIRALVGPTAPRRLHAGELLDSSDRDGQQLHLVLTGFLRAFEVTQDGHEILLEIVPPGGLDGLVPGSGRRGHFTEALQDAVVISLTAAQVEAMLMNPAVASCLIQLLVERVARRESQLRVMAVREPIKRLAAMLLHLGEDLGQREGPWIAIRHRLTHHVLADMIGVRRETVTHALAGLASAEAIKSARDRLLLDPTRLRLGL